MDPGARPTHLDRHLDEVLIGGREQRRIVIAEYDPEWPERFASERARIARALGDHAMRIEHFGSTAVPDLAAKAIVDVLVTVDDVGDDGVTHKLEATGYELRVREPDHRMFRTPERDVHLHVWHDSDPDVDRHLVFRDRLRSDAADRLAYEELKRELARRDWPDMNYYADAKSELIAEIIARAE